jgi:hypothetical protein
LPFFSLAARLACRSWCDGVFLSGWTPTKGHSEELSVSLLTFSPENRISEVLLRVPPGNLQNIEIFPPVQKKPPTQEMPARGGKRLLRLPARLFVPDSVTTMESFRYKHLYRTSDAGLFYW